MSRVKRNKIAMKRRKNVLKMAKGYRGHRSKTEVGAKVAIKKALWYAFGHRKDKKGDMRRLWNVRINAVLREQGTTYSKFIPILKTKNISLDRKILSDLAQNNSVVFKKIVEATK